MSDKLLVSLKEQGFDSIDAAFEHVKALKEADEAAKKARGSGDPLDAERAKALIEQVVSDSLAALDNRATATKDLFEMDPKTEAEEVKLLRLDSWLLGHVLQKRPKELDVAKLRSAYGYHHGRDFSERAIRRALDTTDMAAVVPTELARVFLRDIESSSVVFTNFRILDMPTNPWELPYQSSNMTLYGVSESTDDEASAVKASDLGTAKITLNAKKVGARGLWSRELDESAAIAILPMIREDFVRITREGWEGIGCMGDETAANTNINCVGVVPTTTAGQIDYFLQADGMVHHCIVLNTGQAKAISAAITGALFLATRKLMGKYGDKASELFCLMNRDLVYDAMSLEEFKTPDKYGAQATVLVGELGKMYGTPIGITDGLPLTHTDGKVDGVTPGNNVKKSFVVANRTVGVIIGRRGELRIAVDAINKTDQYEGVIYSRYDFGYSFTKGLAYGYNIT